MLRPRLIPCLLFDDGSLVKTVGFSAPQYIGDPLNVVHIFNEKEVDEIVFLDIGATPKRREPDYETLRLIASEAFIPLAYGGGVRTVDQARAIFECGFEKVVLNTAAHSDPDLVPRLAATFGSQSVVVSLDVKKGIFGKYGVYSCGGRKKETGSVVEAALHMQNAGAGEILLTSIDRDGTWKGYDLDLIRLVAEAVSVPVVACGGAGSLADCGMAVSQAKASAAAAGSMFVFQKQGCGVLIRYPDYDDIRRNLG